MPTYSDSSFLLESFRDDIREASQAYRDSFFRAWPLAPGHYLSEPRTQITVAWGAVLGRIGGAEQRQPDVEDTKHILLSLDCYGQCGVAHFV